MFVCGTAGPNLSVLVAALVDVCAFVWDSGASFICACSCSGWCVCLYGTAGPHLSVLVAAAVDVCVFVWDSGAAVGDSQI